MQKTCARTGYAVLDVDVKHHEPRSPVIEHAMYVHEDRLAACWTNCLYLERAGRHHACAIQLTCAYICDLIFL